MRNESHETAEAKSALVSDAQAADPALAQLISDHKAAVERAAAAKAALPPLPEGVDEDSNDTLILILIELRRQGGDPNAANDLQNFKRRQSARLEIAELGAAAASLYFKLKFADVNPRNSRQRSWT